MDKKQCDKFWLTYSRFCQTYLFIHRKRKKEKISSKTICGKIRKYLDLGKGEAESIVLSKEEKGISAKSRWYPCEIINKLEKYGGYFSKIIEHVKKRIEGGVRVITTLAKITSSRTVPLLWGIT